MFKKCQVSQCGGDRWGDSGLCKSRLTSCDVADKTWHLAFERPVIHKRQSQAGHDAVLAEV